MKKALFLLVIMGLSFSLGVQAQTSYPNDEVVNFENANYHSGQYILLPYLPDPNGTPASVTYTVRSGDVFLVMKEQGRIVITGYGPYDIEIIFMLPDRRIIQNMKGILSKSADTGGGGGGRGDERNPSSKE